MWCDSVINNYVSDDWSIKLFSAHNSFKNIKLSMKMSHVTVGKEMCVWVYMYVCVSVYVCERICMY